MAGLDTTLFRAMNRWPDGLDPWLTYFSVANDGPYFKIVIALIVIGMALRGGRPCRAALLSLVAFPVSDGLCNLLKMWCPVRRPYQDLAHVLSRVGVSDSMGTASSHAANLAAVATVMTLGLGMRWGSPWIAIALVVGASRIYVGAHYPSQVLLGYAVGIGIGAGVDELARRLERKCLPLAATPQAEKGSKGAWSNPP